MSVSAMLDTDGKLRFDLTVPGFDHDPFPVYSYMRENEPVYWWEEGNAWIVTRYDDVVQTLRDPRFSVEFRWYGPAHLPDEQLTEHHLLTKYGIFWMPNDEHNRLRGVMAPHFTSKAIAGMREKIESLAGEILSKADGASRYDIVEDFTVNYQVQAVARILGIPGDRYKEFIRFASSILDAFYPALGAEAYDEKMSYLPHGVEMVRELIAESRAKPREGLLSNLANAEKNGVRLTEQELLSAIALVISAGSEPTRHLIAFTMWNLLRHPDQLAILKAEPGLLNNAIGEVGRYDSMGKLNFPRFPTEDLEMGGKQIKAGTPVYGVFASAMRDPEVFPDAGRFDIRRDLGRSLIWSEGLHNCMGRWIAQMIIEVGVTALFEKFPTAVLDGGPVYAPDTFFRKMVSLPLNIPG